MESIHFNFSYLITKYVNFTYSWKGKWHTASCIFCLNTILVHYLRDPSLLVLTTLDLLLTMIWKSSCSTISGLEMPYHSYVVNLRHNMSLLKFCTKMKDAVTYCNVLTNCWDLISSMHKINNYSSDLGNSSSASEPFTMSWPLAVLGATDNMISRS